MENNHLSHLTGSTKAQEWDVKIKEEIKLIERKFDLIKKIMLLDESIT